MQCNRSLEHPAIWSEFSRALPKERREELLERVWSPHREAVRRLVGEVSAHPDVPGRRSTCAVHIGVHTFTPAWRGRRRTTDIGILYDPSRLTEARLARLWRDGLNSVLGAHPPGASHFDLHLNRPYRGWTDGLTTSLRAEFPATRYLGLELEVSQALVPVEPRIATALAQCLLEALDRLPLG